MLTKGYNVSARYGFGRWLSVGGNFTQMNVRDNEKMQIGSTGNSVENLGYKARIPNVPYQFADFDVNFYWRASRQSSCSVHSRGATPSDASFFKMLQMRACAYWQ